MFWKHKRVVGKGDKGETISGGVTKNHGEFNFINPETLCVSGPFVSFQMSFYTLPIGGTGPRSVVGSGGESSTLGYLPGLCFLYE